MADVATLLRDAVPIEEVEPDIGAVTALVRSRRRRRILGRAAGSVAAVALVGVGSFALVGRDGEPTTVVTSAENRSATAAGNGQAPLPDASEFVRLLAQPSLPTALTQTWRTTPAEFSQLGPDDRVVTGTLQEVRAAPSGKDFCMFIRECVLDRSVELVIRVDRALVGSTAAGTDLVLDWRFGREASSAPEPPLDITPLQQAAPLGSRVLLLFSGDPDAPVPRPLQPSGIVIEDPDGVAVPQADPAAPDVATAFDDYVFQLEQLLGQG